MSGMVRVSRFRVQSFRAFQGRGRAKRRMEDNYNLYAEVD
jgi:hypothetical protein